MEIKRLGAEHYDELLNMLNYTFTKQNKKEMNFLEQLPRMWVRSDEYMGKHIGLFEDGRLCATVGIYPLPVRICGEELLFATTGNIATLPEYEGRGYFSTLFPLAMKELEEQGYDAARLGGQRQRYERYGFADGGQLYRCVLTEANRIKCLGQPKEDLELIPLMEDDLGALAYARKLANSKPFCVERYGNDNERDVFRCMHAKNSVAYMARRNGKWIGYVCAARRGTRVYEMRAENTADFMDILCAWQARVGETLEISIPPHMKEEFAALSTCCQDITLEAPAMFRILCWERVCNALMKLSHSLRNLPKGEACVAIEGYGVLRFYVREDGAGCERDDGATPDLTVDHRRATGLLFGPFDPAAWLGDVPLLLHAYLPLPLTWSFMDFV